MLLRGIKAAVRPCRSGTGLLQALLLPAGAVVCSADLDADVQGDGEGQCEKYHMPCDEPRAAVTALEIVG